MIPTDADRIRNNGSERVAFARGKCEADGMHHPTCTGEGNVIHHVYRKHDVLPEGANRHDFDKLRWLYNGTTTLGAGACHGRVHQEQTKAELLGLLAAGKGLFGLGLHLPQRFWDKVDIRTPVECWEWQAGCNRSGYGRFNLDAGPELAPRLVMGLRLEAEGLALHHCDNPPCVNPLHLYVGTHADNSADAKSRGRLVSPIGKLSGKSADEDLIFSIRWRREEGASVRAIEAEFEIPHNGWVSRVCNGDRWSSGPWPAIETERSRAKAKELGLLRDADDKWSGTDGFFD